MNKLARRLVVTGALLTACDEAMQPDVQLAVDRPEETTKVQSRLDTSCGGQAANGLPWVHSRCGAPAVIFLDFDGGTYLHDNGPVQHVGYNQDGSDPSSFDPAEQNVIRDAAEKVATWFAPFNVDVTTDPATPGDRAWIIIGNDVESGGAATCGFPNNVGACARIVSGGAESHDAGAVVHELTHVFGSGHNSTFNQWGDRLDTYGAPLDPLHGMVMGGKGGVINKWVLWHGYGSVDGFQDQVQRILDRLDNYGDPYVPDDDVDSQPSTARLMTTSGVRKLAKGVLERPDDNDWYTFTVPTAGYYTVSVVRDPPSFVDVRVKLNIVPGTFFASDDGDPDEQPYQMVNDSFISPVWLTPFTTYSIHVQSHGDYADFGAYEVRVDPMPSGINGNGQGMRWRARDIGLTQIPGFSYANGGTLTIQGHGDMTEVSEDAFHYVFQTLEGDGSITARVEQVSGTNSNSEVGVMIRDGLSPLAPHVAVVASYNSTKRLLARDVAGQTSIAVPVESGGNFSPVWVRLTRSGPAFTGEVADGPLGPWRPVGSRLVSMGSRVNIGLAVARNYRYLSTGSGYAQISSVSTTGNVNPQPNLNLTGPPPSLSYVSASMNSVTFNLTSPPGTTTLMEKSRDGVNFETAGFFVAQGSPISVGGLRGGHRYWFRGMSIFSDGSYSVPTSVITTITHPGPVTNVTVSNVAGSRDTTLNIDWNETSGESGYRVLRAPAAAGPWSAITPVLPPNTPMYTDTGLTPNTPYFYQIETDLIPGPPPSGLIGTARSDIKSRYTALPTTTGGRVNSTTPTSVAMQSNSVSGATSYEIERFTASGSTPTNLTSPTRTFTDTGRSPLQWYRYAMRGKNANTWSNDWTRFIVATPADPANALPPGWTTDDFGSVNAAGVAGMNSGGQFTLIASGSRLSSNAGGLFAGAVEAANGWIAARVSSLSAVSLSGEPNYPWAQGGVMIRDALADTSTFVAAYATTGRGLRISYRTADGGTVATVEGPEIAAPVRLRVSRTGPTVFDATYSTDGVTWTSLGLVPSVSMGSNVYMGLFANAGANQPDQMEVARFTDVETNFSGGVYP
jgi:hypothetical protein